MQKLTCRRLRVGFPENDSTKTYKLQDFFLRLSTGWVAHFENIKPHNLSTEDWCIPEDLEDDGRPCLQIQ